ncbi:MAG: DUF4116 domain-containing protein, partial [Chlamydiota bacterium]
YASGRLRNDRELVGIALLRNSEAFHFVGESQKDFANAFLEVDIDGMRLRELIPEFQNNEHIVRAAVRQNQLAVQFLGDRALLK